MLPDQLTVRLDGRWSAITVSFLESPDAGNTKFPRHHEEMKNDRSPDLLGLAENWQYSLRTAVHIACSSHCNLLVAKSRR